MAGREIRPNMQRYHTEPPLRRYGVNPATRPGCPPSSLGTMPNEYCRIYPPVIDCSGRAPVMTSSDIIILSIAALLAICLYVRVTRRTHDWAAERQWPGHGIDVT